MSKRRNLLICLLSFTSCPFLISLHLIIFSSKLSSHNGQAPLRSWRRDGRRWCLRLSHALPCAMWRHCVGWAHACVIMWSRFDTCCSFQVVKCWCFHWKGLFGVEALVFTTFSALCRSTYHDASWKNVWHDVTQGRQLILVIGRQRSSEAKVISDVLSFLRYLILLWLGRGSL
jgi:hypothetical protein